MTNEVKPIEDLSFREAIAELDSIVSVLESNSLELEQSLERYERGVSLLKALNTRLLEAEQKVEVLMGDLDTNVDDETTDTTLS
jgi:exodeoxyribonuclease VII small subunit